MTDKKQDLKQMLAESERLYKDTGYYHAIVETKLKDEDPLKFEVFQHRLISACIAARETVKMISGSPMVREAGELCIGIYTPDGDCVVQSAGIAAHIPSMAATIKYMINKGYEKDPGINEGDLFVNNDWAIGDVHASDIYDILPIFHNGVIVAWAITVIMESEIGAVSPGIMPIINWERFTDGLYLSCLKCGSDYELNGDYVNHINMNLRMPDHFLVDRKSAIAGDMKVREELLITLEEFGLDYFDQAMRECIEIERRAQLARVRERLVPGRYRNVQQFEFTGKDMDIPVPYAKVDDLVQEPIEMTVTKEGKLSVDLDGTGKWGWHPCNTNPNAMLGGLALVITQTLSYAGRANTGTEMGLEAKAPYDTLVNPSTTLLASGSAWVNVLGAGGMVVGMLGQGFYSRGYVEEAGTANSGMPGFNFSAEHYMHPGMTLSGIPADYSGLSGWTGPLHDGLNAAGCIHTAELDTGNTEIWEMFMPYNQTGKTFNPYCQGFGRKRSGVNLCFCYLIHENSKILALHDCGISGHNRTIPNTGKFGGYPGPNLHWYVAKNTGVKELAAAQKPIPTRYGNDPKDPFELKKIMPNAEVYKCGAHQVSPVGLDPWDMIFHSSMDNAGGWGDPLERDPAEIERDLNDGLMPPEMSLGVYGVACSYDKGKKVWTVASAEEVKAQREKMKKARLAKAKPFKEWWGAERKKLQAGDIEPWIKASYNESIARSQNWKTEFRQFWGLAEDATF